MLIKINITLIVLYSVYAYSIIPNETEIDSEKESELFGIVLDDLLHPPHNSDSLNFTNYRKYFVQIVSQRTEAPPIYLNLSKLLANFQDERCLIAINNFLGVDFGPIGHTPIVLRKFGLALLAHDISILTNASGSQFNQLIWATSNSTFNKTGSSDEPTDLDWYLTFPCHISKKFNPTILRLFTTYQTGYCVNLNKTEFQRASKPWQCEIQVDLFMISEALQAGILTNIFQQDDSDYFLSLIKSVSPVNILLHFDHADFYEHNNLHLWITRKITCTLCRLNYFQGQSPYKVVTDVLLAASTVCSQNKLMCWDCQLDNVQTLIPCPYCSGAWNAVKLEIRLLSTQSIAKVNTEYSTAWKFNIFRKGGFNQKIRDYTKVLAETSSKVKLDSIITPLSPRNFDDDIQNRLAVAFASYFLDIFGNIINVAGTKYPFRNIFMVQDNLLYIPNPLLQLTNKLSPLSFITCNSQGYGALRFEEFWKVFDKEVWISTSIVTLILMLCFMVLSTKSEVRLNQEKIVRKLVYLIKVFVEQGDPFPTSIGRAPKFRFMIGGTLLAGVVLSNAYKSTNVYNIVKPKELVPYSLIQDIFCDNLTLYSRVMNLLYRVDFTGDWVEKLRTIYSLNWYPNKISMDSDKYFAFVVGDNEGSFYSDQYNYEWTNYTKHHNRISKTLQTLKAAVVHPRFTSVILEQFENLYIVSKAGLMPSFETNLPIYDEAYDRLEARWLDVFKENFLDHQSSLIFKDLKNCHEKSAWLLPRYVAKYYAKLLLKANSYSNVGEEAFALQKIQKNVEGMLPRNVIRRISASPEYGIIEWLQNIISSIYGKMEYPDIPLEKPNMKGNILVIFVIELAGLGMSLLILILEMHRIILYHMFRFFFFVLSRVRLGSQYICRCLNGLHTIIW